MPSQSLDKQRESMESSRGIIEAKAKVSALRMGVSGATTSVTPVAGSKFGQSVEALAVKVGKLANADGKVVLGTMEEDMLALTLFMRLVQNVGFKDDTRDGGGQSASKLEREAQHEAVLGLTFTIKSPEVRLTDAMLLELLSLPATEKRNTGR